MASETTITLYRADGACSLIPHTILTHFGIPFKAVPMVPSATDLTKGFRYAAADGSLSHEEYLAIHPMGYVPALVVTSDSQSTVITEMPAVLSYISSLAPDQHLLGETPLEKAKVLEWLSWLAGTLHGRAFGGLFRPARSTDNEAAFEGIKSRGHELVKECFARIDEGLSGREFAVGDRLTAVDFNLYPFYRWATMHKFDLETYPAYTKHIKKLEALEGVQKAVAVEGRKLLFA
ncbi:related to glutathione S-transferase GST-6.0 [Cephalotrichum gorgonifer]|uniref:Related to glutathione S-transferase GST-6.0 n=1 Tax=Cephalotrichum gorgonifer TaxID=2041049 RepID=A0AAE8SUD6_9PEZI|nr:related to glutathione S-transferase GST-6.0 [Cephalotrichum gorgonifer]